MPREFHRYLLNDVGSLMNLKKYEMSIEMTLDEWVHSIKHTCPCVGAFTSSCINLYAYSSTLLVNICVFTCENEHKVVLVQTETT